MKEAATAIIIILIIIFSTFITQSSTSGSIREDELATNTSNVISQTLDNAKNTTYKTDAEMAQAFVKKLQETIGTDSKLQIDILDIDCSKTNGRLSVKVTETYRLPNGKERKVLCKKMGYIDNKER